MPLPPPSRAHAAQAHSISPPPTPTMLSTVFDFAHPCRGRPPNLVRLSLSVGHRLSSSSSASMFYMSATPALRQSIGALDRRCRPLHPSSTQEGARDAPSQTLRLSLIQTPHPPLLAGSPDDLVRARERSSTSSRRRQRRCCGARRPGGPGTSTTPPSLASCGARRSNHSPQPLPLEHNFPFSLRQARSQVPHPG